MTLATAKTKPDQRSPVFGSAWRHLTADPAMTFAVGCLALLALLAVVGPLVWRFSPDEISPATLQAPSASHPMGTDIYGRDVFARFLGGARISLGVGASIVLVWTLVGGLIGIVAGTTRGLTDGVLMRVMDALLAFPAIVLAMAIAIGFGPGLFTCTVATMVAGVPYFARVIRSDVLRVGSQPYVEAARGLGASRRLIMRRHIMPHVAPLALIQATAGFGYAILAIAGLSFIGLGAQIPTPEWGAMITDGFNTALTGGWWVGFFPGLGLLVAVTTTGLLADRLQDRLDPRNESTRPR